jgi:hypothetical protein
LLAPVLVPEADESLFDVLAALEPLESDDDPVDFGSVASVTELEGFAALSLELVFPPDSLATAVAPEEEALLFWVESEVDVARLDADELVVAAAGALLVLEMSTLAATSGVEVLSEAAPAAEVILGRSVLEVESMTDEATAASVDRTDEVAALEVSITEVATLLEAAAITSVDNTAALVDSITLDVVELKMSVVGDTTGVDASDVRGISVVAEGAISLDTGEGTVSAVVVSIILVSGAGRIVSEEVGAALGISDVVVGSVTELEIGAVGTDSGTVTGSTLGGGSVAVVATGVALGTS